VTARCFARRVGVAKYNFLFWEQYGQFGYLTEVNLNEYTPLWELIIRGEFVTEKRMMLDVSIKHGRTVTNVGDVLNDVVIQSRQSVPHEWTGNAGWPASI